MLDLLGLSAALAWAMLRGAIRLMAAAGNTGAPARWFVGALPIADVRDYIGVHHRASDMTLSSFHPPAYAPLSISTAKAPLRLPSCHSPVYVVPSASVSRPLP